MTLAGATLSEASIMTVRLQDFGETPSYVVKRKEEMQRAQDEYDAYVAEHFRRGAMRQLTDEERQVTRRPIKSGDKLS